MLAYVPTPLRAPITILEQTQTFFYKAFDLRQFLQNVKEFDLFESMLIKNSNHILNHGI